MEKQQKCQKDNIRLLNVCLVHKASDNRVKQWGMRRDGFSGTASSETRLWNIQDVVAALHDGQADHADEGPPV
eukprot:2653046-Amphidinium_carterae.3